MMWKLLATNSVFTELRGFLSAEIGFGKSIVKYRKISSFYEELGYKLGYDVNPVGYGRV